MSEHAHLQKHKEEKAAAPAAGFVLTVGDVELFKLLHAYRFLRREHFTVLTNRPAKRLHRRLLKLVENGYITAIRFPRQKHIYALAKAALPILVEHGIADLDLLSQRLRTHELKELFLNHEMMIVDLHTVLDLAIREGTLRLIDWREGRGLYDTVQVADNAGVRWLPVRPDAFFTLEDSRRPEGANRAWFFLEADRSTTTQTRFKEKIRAYWNYLEQGLHTKKYGIKNFRVLTVTLTVARAQNLRDLAAAELPERARKYFLFASIGSFSLDSAVAILEPVWLSARERGTYHQLIPTPAPPPIGT